MKAIKFWTSYFNRDSAFWQMWLGLDPERFTLVFDGRDPDYLIVTPHIYSSDAARDEFARLYDASRVSIFIAMECAFPDMNLFDYAVAFNRDLDLNGRVVRCPTRSFDPLCKCGALDRGCDDPAAELARKTGFCNFIYSNGHAHPHRDWLFHTLSSYKRVDSLGCYLNNCGNPTSRTDKDWRSLAVEQKRPYKFSIAAENALSPGYATEKIVLSFMSHSIPIYWGDPEIAVEFNERAFVNANGLSAEELIARVRELDENDEKYKAMLAEPPMTAEQCRTAAEQERRYRDFTAAIFSVPKDEAKRAPAGTWVDYYYKPWALTPTPKMRTEILRVGRYSLSRDEDLVALGPLRGSRVMSHSNDVA